MAIADCPRPVVNSHGIQREGVCAVHVAHLLSWRFGYAALLEDWFEAAERLGLAEGPTSVVAEDAAPCYPWDSPADAVIKYWLNHRLRQADRERVLGAVAERRLGDVQPLAEAHYMSPEQMRELHDSGNRIGLHSHRHLLLEACDDVTLASELGRNARFIEGELGVPPRWISYPYGTPDSFGPRVFEAMDRVGVRYGFTMSAGYAREGVGDNSFFVWQWLSMGLLP